MTTTIMPVAISARVEASALSAALRVVLPTAFGKQPIHSGVKITADVGVLRLECTNGDRYSSTTVDAAIDEPGALVVPAKILDAFMHSVTGATELKMRGTKLVVTCGTAVMELHTLPAEEWLRFEELSGPYVDLTPHWPGIRRVLYAAASEKEKDERLRAIRFDPVGVACCDRYRAAAYLFDNAGPGANVPASLVEQVIKAGDQRDIKMAIGERVASFRSGRSTFSGRLIAGDFPHWQNLLRKSSSDTLTMGREPLLGVLARMKILSDDAGFQRVCFDRDGDSLVLSSSGPDVGSITDEIPCSGSFTEIIEFELHYLVDMAQNHTGDEITFEFETIKKPVQTSDGPWTATAMPVIKGTEVSTTAKKKAAKNYKPDPESEPYL